MCVCGGGGGGGPALLIVYQPQTKGQGNGSQTCVFEIKEADYQTTCCCCFKTRVARGGFGRTKADLAHKT